MLNILCTNSSQSARVISDSSIAEDIAHPEKRNTSNINIPSIFVSFFVDSGNH